VLEGGQVLAHPSGGAGGSPEARGGLLVKYHAGEPQASEDDLRAELERHGLEVGRLEREGRFRFA